MSASSIRYMIIVLTLFTAAVHGVVLNLQMGTVDVLFTLNALGYLALLGALLAGWPPSRSRLVHYAFIGYTAFTILAWLVVNGDFSDPVGLSNKVGEALLVVFLWLHLGATQTS